MRYYKLLNDDYGDDYKEGQIYPETYDHDWVTLFANSDSFKHEWKEVSEIEYIKQQGWYIRGSNQFREWLDNNGVNKRGYHIYSDTFYYIENNKVKICSKFADDKGDKEIEITIDQLNEIYNVKPKEMENFEVKVTPTTSKILQELAFENGWKWNGEQTDVQMTGESPLVFHGYKKAMTARLSTYKSNVLSLEEAINRITTKEEPFKEGDWFAVDNCHGGSETWIGKVGEKYEYTNGGSWSYPKSFIKNQARKATNKEIESALIKEAKRRGFPVKRWNSPDGALQFNSKLNDSWTYNREQDKLRNNGGLVYEKGKWAEIVDEPKEIFGFKVDYTEAGFVQFGCSDHRYTINELEHFISTLRNVKAQTTVGELLSELRDVLKY